MQVHKMTFALLMISGLVTGCKNKDERPADDVASARDKFVAAQKDVAAAQKDVVAERKDVVAEQKDVVAEQADVNRANVDLAKARAEFQMALDKRLAVIDQRIEAARTSAAIDHERLTALRAEALALRTKVANQAEPYSENMHGAFDRISHDIDVELDKK
ncbi:MAG: hypothetical protein IPL61_13310 [Myxococcales bacterium]|nr:hypothetical protein [Myxococcales bacterium]